MTQKNNLRPLMTTTHGLKGVLQVPGDKSISHRAIMLGSIAKGTTIIKNLLLADDVLTTITIYRQLGVSIQVNGHITKVDGLAGFNHFTDPKYALDFGNSGTTLRLSLGLLAAQPFSLKLIGDASLTQRPMGRVLNPLSQMGLHLDQSADHLPLQLEPNTSLQGITYTLPIASAQVKSALIFAALQANTSSVIVEPTPSRNHTETMLASFGVTIEKQANQLTVVPNQELMATTLTVPGDFSSAAFFVVAALLVSDSDIELLQVGLNQTRTGLLDALHRMGGVIEIIDQQRQIGEAYGNLRINEQPALQAIDINETAIPSMIDELPLLVLVATQAQGVTKITGARELRYKETDRIKAVTTELNRLGADIVALPDGFIVTGPTKLQVTKSTVLSSHGDHRIGMMLAIAALITEGEVVLDDAEAINISYPNFFSDLATLLN